MKILRANLNGINIYLADPNGKAEMLLSDFKNYIKALDIICLFEKEVDKQYDLEKSPSINIKR